MPVATLDHYSLECGDLEATRAFYCDVLGLSEGFRPGFDFPGHWLYCGGAPVVHLMKHAGRQRPVSETGRLDHIAFNATDPEGVVARLEARGIAFRRNRVPDIDLTQIFVRDPDGLQVELNFRGTSS